MLPRPAMPVSTEIPWVTLPNSSGAQDLSLRMNKHHQSCLRTTPALAHIGAPMEVPAMLVEAYHVLGSLPMFPDALIRRQVGTGFKLEMLLYLAGIASVT
jgi:hypothetical protein